MTFHVGSHTIVGGHLGVDLFFVLSGFLITSLLVQEWNQFGAINLRLFYIRRALRLFPALFAVIVVCSIYSDLFATSTEQSMLHKGVFYSMFYSSNWYQAFNGMGTLGILSHTWSLSIEEQFYILWPPLLAYLLRLKCKHWRVLMALTVTIIFIALNRAVLWQGQLSFARVYASLDTRADAILLGCLLGLLTSWKLLPMLSRRITLVLSISLCLLLTIMFLFCSNYAGYMYRGGLAGFAAAAATFVYLLLTWMPRFITTILEFSPLAWIGRLSYGLYLWHIPIFNFCYNPSHPLPLRLLTAFGVTFATATVCYYLIERPCLRFKRRFYSVPRDAQLSSQLNGMPMLE